MGFKSFFSKKKKETLDNGLQKTKEGVWSKISHAIAGKSKVDDDVLDDLHKKTLEFAQSEDFPGTNQQPINVVPIGRFMERLGDHAVSAARRVVFIVSGFDPSKEPDRDEGTDID